MTRPNGLRVPAMVLAMLLCGVVRAGLASVIGSPHDLYRHGYMVVKEEVLKRNPQCEQCHFNTTDERPLIWQVVPPSMTAYGLTGTLCASCHDGISVVDRNVDAGLTVFNPLSHGLDPARAPSFTKMDQSGLPVPEKGLLACQTCHDPHEQTFRPFLRVPFAGLCVRCHANRKADGVGPENRTGDHPVDMEPYDNTGGATPIAVGSEFATPFPRQFPQKMAILSTNAHWRSGGHLGFGTYGKVECSTCHALHGGEAHGPVKNLLAKDSVGRIADEFCEGCHQGERGDDGEMPPYPNPGGTKTGRTYHPVDDDEANGAGWIISIADTSDLSTYRWGENDPDADLPRLLCTTCHRAHGGLDNSPSLVAIAKSLEENDGITTFCEICHREPPEGHHAYKGRNQPSSSSTVRFTTINTEGLGHTYGSPKPGTIYCSHCHRAHNAGYGMNEPDFIPLLVFKGDDLCSTCHLMGVSHFLGDPTLPSTYQKSNPALKRDPWPSGRSSFYAGGGEQPVIITCQSCHDLNPHSEGDTTFDHLLLAPADEATEWAIGSPEVYLCTGCHGEAPATVGKGQTHPLMDADATLYPDIGMSHLLPGEAPVTYTPGGRMNCHSCHLAHGAPAPGGVYILKIVRGANTDPKAIRPSVDYAPLCDSCHPYL